MTEKEKFINLLKPLFEQNIIKPIYISDTISVLSFKDYFYVACPSTITKNDFAYGCIIKGTVNDLLNIINHPIGYIRMIGNYTQEEFDKKVFILDPKKIDTYLNIIQKYESIDKPKDTNENVNNFFREKYGVPELDFSEPKL